MPALHARNEGMQYTLRNVPLALDRRIRAICADEGLSLNEALLRLLKRATGLDGDAPGCRDLSDVAGTWVEDPDCDAALAEQRQIEEALWR